MTKSEIESHQSAIELLKQRLSEARRASVPESVGEYTFAGPSGHAVSLRELFGHKTDLLVIHNMGKRCVYCTMWADGLNGLAEYLLDRSGLVLTTPDEPAIAQEFARSRGWKFPVVSLAGNRFARDMGFEPETGRHMPGVSAFLLKPDGQIVRTGSAQFGPGDDFCPAWAMFDLLSGGAGTWTPKRVHQVATPKPSCCTTTS